MLFLTFLLCFLPMVAAYFGAVAGSVFETQGTWDWRFPWSLIGALVCCIGCMMIAYHFYHMIKPI